jgi:hypothetical protein
VLRGFAELEYLQGDYEAAEPLLRRVVEESGRDLAARLDAEVALALVFLQTDRYAEAGDLFVGLDAIELPIWELTKSFGDEEPYRLDWGGAAEVTLPFVPDDHVGASLRGSSWTGSRSRRASTPAASS